jgi:hypothetical protein
MKHPNKNEDYHNGVSPELEQLFNTQQKKELLCVYTILRKEKKLSSRKLVEIALSQEFNHYCHGCAAADNIYRAVKKLQEMGFVFCNLEKGGYVWEFIED